MLTHDYLNRHPFKKYKGDLLAIEKKIKIPSLSFSFLDYFDDLYHDVAREAKISALGYVYLSKLLAQKHWFVDTQRYGILLEANNSTLHKLVAQKPGLSDTIHEIYNCNLWDVSEKYESLELLFSKSHSYNEFRIRYEDINYRHWSYPMIGIEVLNHYSAEQCDEHRNAVKEIMGHIFKGFGYYYDVVDLIKIDKEKFSVSDWRYNPVLFKARSILVEEGLWESDEMDKRETISLIMATGIIEQFFLDTCHHYRSAMLYNDTFLSGYKGHKYRERCFKALYNNVNHKLDLLKKMYA